MEPIDFSFANLANLPMIEDLYARYLADPQSVDLSWRYFFEGLALGISSMPKAVVSSDDLLVYHLIEAYRKYGHLLAKINPINTTPPKEPLELNLRDLGFKEEMLDKPFPTCGFLKQAEAPLREILDALRKTYCGTIGVEYMDLGVPEIEAWIQKRIEPGFPLNLSTQEKIDVLYNLNKAELFETFLHTKYVGQKRFSLEGGETLIPMLASIIQVGADEDVQEVIVGMTHRGRLNVLANILNKPYGYIFQEFEDFYSPDMMEGTGDVKYHKGFLGSLSNKAGNVVSVILAANPSHLEAVDPVVEGMVRAQQEKRGDKLHRKEVVPILLHGDAALAGQGVVYETLQFCRLNGYSTGGTLHIVVNNQIGFTTLPKDSRSTRYCTDIAKAFGAPVFHVNAEDPEGCVAVAKMAIELRQKFQCDVFIDLNCYRKYGHNESDEPNFTQPVEYQLIKEKKPIRLICRDKLIAEGMLDEQTAAQIEADFKQTLQAELDAATEKMKIPPMPRSERAAPNLFETLKTGVDGQTLIKLTEAFCKIPEGFSINPKIQRLFQDRLAMVKGDPEKPTIDWGMGEYLAYATLLDEKIHVRLSGQDSRRGTFSHRHAMWVDQKNEERYFPLSHLKSDQGLFDVFNSHLSEYGVLGFEFGYNLFYSEALVLWEAQFGDFANGAQVMIDQFIASAEQKWGQRSSLVMLLPHGYEGQGPEHSSGRIERFLQLCGHDNMQVANCTTPAQLFHLFRRQALRLVKKPLILFTPKALLRYPACVSSLRDFEQGSFQEILDDPTSPVQARHLFLCSGKVYYDLIAEREKRKANDIAILRLEQLYPLNQKRLKELLAKYSGVQGYTWVQEEHSNMGGWEYIRPLLEEILNKPLRYAGRDRSASPAAGSHTLHKKQLIALLEEAFKI